MNRMNKVEYDSYTDKQEMLRDTREEEMKQDGDLYLSISLSLSLSLSLSVLTVLAAIDNKQDSTLRSSTTNQRRRR